MRFLLLISSVSFSLLLSGCANQTQNIIPPENVAEFTTQDNYDGVVIPHETLKRAAYTTLRRGYSHFTIAPTTQNRKSGWRPVIGVDYGRDPNGFGIAGLDTAGFGIGAGITTGGSSRIHWRVVMYKADSNGKINVPNGQRLYNAAAITR